MSTQSLSHLLLPEGEFRVIRCDIADKVLACADGDSALLYLYNPAPRAAAEADAAMRALGLTRARYERALFTLTSLTVAGQPENRKRNPRPAIRLPSCAAHAVRTTASPPSATRSSCC